MNSILEVTRASHEAIDMYEQALAAIQLQPTKTHKQQLEKDHRQSDILNRIVARKASLQDHYADPTGIRAQEIALLSAPPPPADDLEEFYTRLVQIKDFHRKNPNVDSRALEEEIRTLVEGPQQDEEDELVLDEVARLFSGEESMGRFLDVYESHSRYINLKGVSRLPYLAYLDLLAKGAPDTNVSKKERGSQVYLEYIQSLHAYLSSFLSRTKPLLDLSEEDARAEAAFAPRWDESKLAGWEEESEEGPKGTAANGAAPAAEGIWCPACQKMYSKQTVYDAHLKSKKHEKAAARLTSSASSSDPSSSTSTPTNASLSALRHAKLRPVALLTYQVSSLLLSPLLSSLLSDTKSNVERRAALTARERELELAEPSLDVAPTGDGDEPMPEEEDEDEEARIFNPLKLPMGWDGKPIPYWLYKLHGLGVEYRCEICSDYAYMGRKNFERHFQESRHAFGMRALGLPNTKHFHEITKIEDALALAERLKQDGKQDQRSLDTMEEIEDSEGNVYDKRTYEDLKRQGLV